MTEYDIDGYTVHFDSIKHQYFVNGKPIISVTQLIDGFFPRLNKRVDPEILQKAADQGTTMHDMIIAYEQDGLKTYHLEMQSYLALKRQHQFAVLDSTKIILLRHQGVVIAAGMFDMIVTSPFMKGQGIAQIKRQIHLDEARLNLQLNLYKLGYEQTYRQRIHYLKCLHIRHRHTNYVDVPVDVAAAKALLERYSVKHPNQALSSWLD